MESNNLSRVQFKKFCKDNNVNRVDSRNVFQLGELRICWVNNLGNEVRQFYEDCHGAYINGTLYDKADLTLTGVTRVTSKGLKAYNAVIKKELKKC